MIPNKNIAREITPKTYRGLNPRRAATVPPDFFLEANVPTVVPYGAIQLFRAICMLIVHH